MQAPEEALTLLQKTVIAYNYFQLEKKNLSFSRTLAREQLSPTEAYTIIHEQALGPIPPLKSVNCHLYRCRSNHLTTLIHTHAILGETLSFLHSKGKPCCAKRGGNISNENEFKIINQVLIEHTNVLSSGLRHRRTD
ncbi:hypothetical protein MASR2M36_38870 [Providencia sp.]